MWWEELRAAIFGWGKGEQAAKGGREKGERKHEAADLGNRRREGAEGGAQGPMGDQAVARMGGGTCHKER